MTFIPPKSNRRKFLKKAVSVPLLPVLGAGVLSKEESRFLRKPTQGKIKLSCNLYTFNAPLRSGEMTLEEVVRFCADLGFDAVDPTGYYFPGYPEAPDDAFLYAIKKKAFLLGLDISGTGVRNDFTSPMEKEREANIDLVRRWLEVAAKMGAPVVRIFDGKGNPQGSSEKETLDRIIKSIKTCVPYAKQRGVMLVLQNHNEFIKTADQVLYIREQVGSDWFGLNVDIGSLPQGDPYEEIAKLAPYAYTWQIKENVNRGGKEEKTDLNRIVRILRETGYRGYIPLETLGEGDPKAKITRFLNEVRQALA
jgi:sugar phosphate isomerase/epimerase